MFGHENLHMAAAVAGVGAHLDLGAQRRQHSPAQQHVAVAAAATCVGIGLLAAVHPRLQRPVPQAS